MASRPENKGFVWVESWQERAIKCCHFFSCLLIYYISIIVMLLFYYIKENIYMLIFYESQLCWARVT